MQKKPLLLGKIGMHSKIINQYFAQKLMENILTSEFGYSPWEQNKEKLDPEIVCQ